MKRVLFDLQTCVLMKSNTTGIGMITDVILIKTSPIEFLDIKYSKQEVHPFKTARFLGVKNEEN